MTKIPAFCDECGKVFSSGFNFSNSFNISFAGCQAGPCPSCGGMGHIPDGVYNFIDNAIELLQRPNRTVEELKILANILRKSRIKNSTIEQIKEEVATTVPELSPLTNFLPATRQEFYTFISIILTILTFMDNVMKNDNKTKTEVQQVVNYIYQQDIRFDNNVILKKKIGRNQTCPCGSGIKYKKCCGFN
ncbi:MAG: hypothetical protein H6Q68_274 [Firmicutes bacterium]|nr:hypothetical protein [Bacillota bacterium]